MTICVLGSLNMDLVVRSTKLPIPGETVQGHSLLTVPGGKGANQAVAVQRLGVPVHMVGRVGNDAYGRALQEHLSQEGVGLEGLRVERGCATGVAIVAVADSGENQILIIPGANGQVDLTDVDRLNPLLHGADALLLQLEIPLPVVVAAAQAAHELGIRVILDPAPAPEALPNELYPLIDVLTPNQNEASRLTGISINSPDDALRVAQTLQRRGPKRVVVTFGKRGAFCATADTTLRVPTFPVTVVDTTAAGDAFNAALAVGLVEGQSFYESLIRASAAGALTTTLPGAQTSLPYREALDAFLETHVADTDSY